MKNRNISLCARGSFLAVVAAAFFWLSGCGGGSSKNPGGNAVPSLVSIAVSASNSSVIVGQTDQLTATGTYSDKSTKDLTSSVQWSASPSAAVTISASGLLTANASGTVSITAALNSVSGGLKLNIAPKLVSIAITPSTASIAPATKQQFTATGTYSDNSTGDVTSLVSWSSSSTAFATVSSTPPTSGLALAISPGTTTITASLSGISSSASLTVTNAYPVKLVINPSSATMALFVSQQFAATATFNDNSTQDVSNVANWSSSSIQNATVTATGLVTAKQVTNSVTISASFTGFNNSTVQASAVVTINASNLTTISISPPGPIAQGTKVQFEAVGTFNDGSTHDLTSQVAWSSDNTSVLKFLSGSTASGVAPGSANITATLSSASGNVTGTIPFQVSNASIQSIAITPANPSVDIGGHVSFAATGSFSDGSTQDITISSSWTSTNTNVATVGSSGSSYGVATAVASGSATITATFGSVIGSDTMTVTSGTLKSVAVKLSSQILAPGSTEQAIAVGTWTDGTSQPITQNVTWSETDTSGTNVATVSGAGVITGNSPGTATVTATVTLQSGTFSGSAVIAVEPSPLSCIEVTPPGVPFNSNCAQFAPQSANVPDNIQLPFTAWGIFGSAQLNLTASANWTSSNGAVATIGNGAANSGIASGASVGNTTISASFGGQTGTATLNVTNATLVSIAVSPSSATIPLGSSQQFTATGTFSDKSTVVITNQVTWSSSDPNIAVVKSTGNAVSAGSGTVTIQATMGTVSGTATLTVQ